MADKEELRKSLRAALVRNEDALDILSAVSYVSESKIKEFVNGDDDALSMVELMSVNGLK